MTSVSTASPVTLTLERIETIGIVAPLAREFRGSHYRMTHRATVITRLYTAKGSSARRTPATRSTPSDRSSARSRTR